MMTIEKYYSETVEHEAKNCIEYREKYYSWTSDDQWLCILFLRRFFSGFHHFPTEPKPCDKGIEMNFRPAYMGSFDYDALTKLVIMSHNWAVRSEIAGSGPAMIKLKLFYRGSRDGRMQERHPTIDEAIDKFKDF